MDKLFEAKHVFDVEIEALSKTRDALDETFVQILDLIVNCSGKVIITGMGKPGHIASKMAATFSSLGTPSFCIHAAEAMHGDLGMISENDIVIVISYSGESDEIIKILPNIKWIGATIVAITGNADSTLAGFADVVQVLPKFNEACYLGLAPTSSTTAVLCYGDALAVVASGIYGFKNSDFGMYHPAGALGKKLILKVDDLMLTSVDIFDVKIGSSLTNAINEMAKNGVGAVAVTNTENNLCGIISDGDLRRSISKKVDIYRVNVEDIMTCTPKIIRNGKLAVEALNLMKKHSITVLPVVDEKGTLKGIITMQDILKAGIIV